MVDLVVRCWADGLDFVGTSIHRKNNIKAGRSGFGDMICEVSNLCMSPFFEEGGSVLAPDYHPAHKKFIDFLSLDLSHWKWISDNGEYNRITKKSKDWHSLNEIRPILHCHSIYEDYVKLDKDKFIECNDLVDTTTEYATIQTIPFSRKCQYTQDHIKQMEDQYQLGIIEIGGKEKLGMNKIAYIIDKAKYHIGIDSGMSHFALTIKNKEDVHLYVPEQRQTSVCYRWIKNGYNVKLI